MKTELESKYLLDLPTVTRLEILYWKMHSRKAMKIGFKELLVNELGNCDIQKFTSKVGRCKWEGYLYKQHNNMMGTVFSKFAGKPFIVRGFPKIQYVDKTWFKKELFIEEKCDGTNIVMWQFPNGKLMGKTRERYWYCGQGYRGMNWEKLVEKTGLLKNIKALCNQGFSPAFELYGYLNPGEFIKYSFSIRLALLEVADANNSWRYVPYDTKKQLADCFELPMPKLIANGILGDRDELERMRINAANYIIEDGMEGFVAKLYDPIVKDVVMGKIKCDAVRELCFKLNPKMRVPKSILSKNAKKCSDEGISPYSEEGLKFILKELEEDYTQEEIAVSLENIKRYLQKLCKGSVEDDNRKLVIATLEEMVKDGEDVSFKYKNEVMSKLHNKLPGVEGGVLYHSYVEYVTSGSGGD